MTKSIHLIILCTALALSACGPAEDAGPQTCGAGTTRCAAPDGWPTWQLEDIQPDSPRFGQTYGLDVFEGRVVFVAYLVGWCPYCQSQTSKLEELRLELEGEGVDVAFVTVHGTSANNADDQEALTSRCSFPILQDTEDVGAWDASGGGKDDFTIYGPTGEVLAYLPPSSGTNLGDADDYAALKARLVEAAGAQ